MRKYIKVSLDHNGETMGSGLRIGIHLSSQGYMESGSSAGCVSSVGRVQSA
jgi:hypothetical protein